jgi:hypothetical protein
MSAMDLDAPVSIAPQFRQEQTGATQVYLFLFKERFANRFTAFSVVTVALQSMEQHPQVLFAMTASNSPSTCLREYNAKRHFISAEIATDGFFPPQPGLLQHSNQENSSPFV